MSMRASDAAVENGDCTRAASAHGASASHDAQVRDDAIDTAAIDFDRAQPVVDAVLYEGYILYPYRPTSAKNRQRWTFGGVYPRAYAQATDGAEPWRMQTQCLLHGDGRTRLAVRVRFLQPLSRQIGRIDDPPDDGSAPGGRVQGRPVEDWAVDGEPAFTPVGALVLGERQFHSWQEAIERDVAVADCTVAELQSAGRRLEFAFPGCRDVEPIRDDQGLVRGLSLRQQADICGLVTLDLQDVGDGAFRVCVGIENHTAMEAAGEIEREQAGLYSFASTHTLLGARDGGFVSLMDPPAALAAAARECENQGAYPVLVGEPGSSDLMLSSPIILYDHPQIAPESPGDLFDATEIDEILSLRILTLTDAEKREMVATDPRAAALLARTEALDGDALMRLHGIMRKPRPEPFAPAAAPAPAVEPFPEPRPTPPRLAVCNRGERQWRVGQRVRLCPGQGGDVWDTVLRGMTAVIEGIERDFEDRLHIAVAIEDDPGHEWGMQRMPGHRFFFSPEEVEALDDADAGGVST